MSTNTSQFKNRKQSITKEEVQRLKVRCRIRLVRDHGLVKGLNQVRETEHQGINKHLETKL